MSMFDLVENSSYTCPRCSGAMVKVTRPVNHQVYQCRNCSAEFGEGYLEGWNNAKGWIAEYESALASIGVTKDLETLEETGEMSWLYETDGGPQPASSVAEALQECFKLRVEGNQ